MKKFLIILILLIPNSGFCYSWALVIQDWWDQATGAHYYNAIPPGVNTPTITNTFTATMTNTPPYTATPLNTNTPTFTVTTTPTQNFTATQEIPVYNPNNTGALYPSGAYVGPEPVLSYTSIKSGSNFGLYSNGNLILESDVTTGSFVEMIGNSLLLATNNAGITFATGNNNNPSYFSNVGDFYLGLNQTLFMNTDNIAGAGNIWGASYSVGATPTPGISRVNSNGEVWNKGILVGTCTATVTGSPTPTATNTATQTVTNTPPYTPTAVPTATLVSTFTPIAQTHGATFDGGGGNVIAVGSLTSWTCQHGATITGWVCSSTTSGSVTFDIWRSTFAGFPPTSGNSIVGGNYPAITSSQAATGTVAGWGTTVISPGDMFIYQVKGVATVTNATLALTYSQ